jgi:hypothetical protein
MSEPAAPRRAPETAATPDAAATILARDGIVVLPPLLSADALDGLRRSFKGALARPSFNTWIGYEQNEKWRLLVENLLMLDPACFTLALHPLVTGAIARHVGPGFALTEARGWKTIATKRNFHGWHADAWYHPSVSAPPREVKLGVYLTDVTTGYFSYIAGSHTPQRPARHWPPGEVAPMLSRCLDVPGPAGTAFLFDTAGVHRQSTPVLTPRDVMFFNYHDPSVPIQDEDVRAGRYRPLALNAGFAPNLSPEECRILGFGSARDRAATDAVVGRAALRRFAGLHDLVALALAAWLEWQELLRVARRGRLFLARRARRLLAPAFTRRAAAGE